MQAKHYMFKRLPILEKDIQHAIIERLAWSKNVYFLRSNSISGQIIRPDGSRGWIKNAKRGSPDIILCKSGLWIGLEVKTKEGRQSPEQKQAEEEIRNCGGLYFVVRSVEEVEHILECY